MRDETGLEKFAGYPELLKILLFNRGIRNKEEADIFVSPNFERDTHDPFLIKDMDKAVKRIIKAITNNERIVIFSDYDADGIPGGVVLHDFFKKINYRNFTNYIPHRDLEGFGLNNSAIDEFKKMGVKLIITVDCGITDLVEANSIKDQNIDLIITDHHEPKSKLPIAVAIIDPKRKDCHYPFKELCGAGVVYKLVQAILKKKDFGLKEGVEKWLLDMVGIATLSDMVPLVGENRTSAFFGLIVLRKSSRIGLMKLLSLLKINQNQLVEDDIGFSISPRINAASRIGNPEDAFKLFVTQNEIEADIHARHLDHVNNERKGVVAGMVKEVRKIMKERYVCKDICQQVIVIGNPNWRPSLLGLVANSLVDDHSQPVFLWGRDGGGILKGSCRGNGHVSVLDIMSEVETGIFNEFGGHMMSGGFSLIKEKVHYLDEKIQFAYNKLIKKGELKVAEILVDMELSLDDVNLINYKLIEKLAPFGIGNPKPLFLFKEVFVENVKTFGKENNHLELTFKTSKSKVIKAIGFFMSSNIGAGQIQSGTRLNLIASFEKSFFRGYSELRLRITDISIF